MSTSLRRRLDALHRLAEHPATPEHERAAAEAAIDRLLERLGDARERLAERADPYQPPRQKRSRRRRTAAERAKEHRLHIGDVLDCDLADHPVFGRCRCGSSTFRVDEGTPPIAVAWLTCTGCRRARKLSREHFEAGARWAS